VERHLGGGGSGRVYRATHVNTGQPCALKLLDADITASEEGMQRVRRETANHARLGTHPHVCRLLDVGTTASGAVYIALEHVEGETLHALLEREVRLAPPRAARIVSQTASALAAAHALGLVHRD